MKTTLATILIALSLCLTSAVLNKQEERAVLISRVDWQVGTAKTCVLDGKEKSGDVHRMFCYTWVTEGEREDYLYYVALRIEGTPKFDKDQWANLTCRLDSHEHAACGSL